MSVTETEKFENSNSGSLLPRYNKTSQTLMGVARFHPAAQGWAVRSPPAFWGLVAMVIAHDFTVSSSLSRSLKKKCHVSLVEKWWCFSLNETLGYTHATPCLSLILTFTSGLVVKLILIFSTELNSDQASSLCLVGGGVVSPLVLSQLISVTSQGNNKNASAPLHAFQPLDGSFPNLKGL